MKSMRRFSGPSPHRLGKVLVVNFFYLEGFLRLSTCTQPLLLLPFFLYIYILHKEGLTPLEERALIGQDTFESIYLYDICLYTGKSAPGTFARKSYCWEKRESAYIS